MRMRDARWAWPIVLASTVSLGAAGLAANETRLVDAVKAGNRDAVRLLLKQHVAVNAPEVDGTTALHWAVRADDLETTEMLLRAAISILSAGTRL